MTHPLYEPTDRLREGLYRAAVHTAHAARALKTNGDTTELLSALTPVIAELDNLHGQCAAILTAIENQGDPT